LLAASKLHGIDAGSSQSKQQQCRRSSVAWRDRAGEADTPLLEVSVHGGSRKPPRRGKHSSKVLAEAEADSRLGNSPNAGWSYSCPKLIGTAPRKIRSPPRSPPRSPVRTATDATAHDGDAGGDDGSQPSSPTGGGDRAGTDGHGSSSVRAWGANLETATAVAIEAEDAAGHPLPSGAAPSASGAAPSASPAGAAGSTRSRGGCRAGAPRAESPVRVLSTGGAPPPSTEDGNGAGPRGAATRSGTHIPLPRARKLPSPRWPDPPLGDTATAGWSHSCPSLVGTSLVRARPFPSWLFAHLDTGAAKETAERAAAEREAQRLLEERTAAERAAAKKREKEAAERAARRAAQMGTPEAIKERAIRGRINRMVERSHQRAATRMRAARDEAALAAPEREARFVTDGRGVPGAFSVARWT